MAKDLAITATVPANKETGVAQIGPFTATVKTGETALEKINLFGDDAVSSNADSNWTVTLQSRMRSAMKRGLDEAAVAALISNAKMGVAAPKTGGGITVATAKSKLLSAWSEMSEEDKKSFMASLKAVKG
jgi:hypothetical protein